MRKRYLAINLMGLAFLTLAAGCSSTDQSAATDDQSAFVTNYDSTADKVTTAADQACDDLKFADINTTGSKVDGKVTAQTTQGDDVSINIEQTGDNLSKVTIRVGSTGDQAMSRELADRIKAHLTWLGS